METSELEKLAIRNRFMREAGIALVLSSIVLAAFLFIPLQKTPQEAVASTVSTSTPDAFKNMGLAAESAIVLDLVTGETLYDKNSNAQLPLASLTKLLTIESAVRELGIDVPITISAADVAVDSPHRFVPGDVLTLADLARLTLTASLNDGAEAIAEATAAREATTTSSMLASAAAALGLTETFALNGSGLDMSTSVSGAYGSAHDIALLAGALVTNAPDIALATTLPKASASTLTGKHYEISNTNPTVEYAPHLLLSKTGYTDLAGGNLALVFDVGINHPIAVVLLGSTEEARFTDGQALVAATLAHFANIDSL